MDRIINKEFSSKRKNVRTGTEWRVGERREALVHSSSILFFLTRGHVYLYLVRWGKRKEEGKPPPFAPLLINIRVYPRTFAANSVIDESAARLFAPAKTAQRVSTFLLNASMWGLIYFHSWMRERVDFLPRFFHIVYCRVAIVNLEIFLYSKYFSCIFIIVRGWWLKIFCDMFDDDISRVIVYFCLKLVYDDIVDCVSFKKFLNCVLRENLQKERSFRDPLYLSFYH